MALFGGFSTFMPPPTIIDYTTGDDLRLISPSKGIFEAVMGGFWNIGPSWY